LRSDGAQADYGRHDAEPDPDETPPDAARATAPKFQTLLAAILVAAIILMIAVGAFWTSF
jgi:hypothetical protein